MTATGATATVEGLAIALTISLAALILLGAMYTAALGVIRVHKMVIEALNENVERERGQKEYWRREFYKVKKAEVKRGERTDS